MIRVLRTLVFFALFGASLVGLVSPALAAPPAPAPSCIPLQPQVKQCSVSAVGGVGTFEAVVTPPAGLVIAFDEPITGMQPPPTSSYRASFSGTTATVVPIRRDPIPGATVHFDTRSVHVTLNLRSGPTPDTQIVIVDPRRDLRDAEVERRVKEAIDGLEERASRLANEGLLDELASGGAAVEAVDVRPVRHDQVVVRADQVVRLGGRRVLLLAIANRSADVLEVRGVRAWTGADGSERELLHPAYQLHGKTVPVNGETRMVLSLPTPPVPAAAGSDRLRVRIEFADPGPSVELAGIRWR